MMIVDHGIVTNADIRACWKETYIKADWKKNYNKNNMEVDNDDGHTDDHDEEHRNKINLQKLEKSDDDTSEMEVDLEDDESHKPNHKGK